MLPFLQDLMKYLSLAFAFKKILFFSFYVDLIIAPNAQKINLRKNSQQNANQYSHSNHPQQQDRGFHVQRKSGQIDTPHHREQQLAPPSFPSVREHLYHYQQMSIGDIVGSYNWHMHYLIRNRAASEDDRIKTIMCVDQLRLLIDSLSTERLKQFNDHPSVTISPSDFAERAQRTQIRDLGYERTIIRNRIQSRIQLQNQRTSQGLESPQFQDYIYSLTFKELKQKAQKFISLLSLNQGEQQISEESERQAFGVLKQLNQQDLKRFQALTRLDLHNYIVSYFSQIPGGENVQQIMQRIRNLHQNAQQYASAKYYRETFELMSKLDPSIAKLLTQIKLYDFKELYFQLFGHLTTYELARFRTLQFRQRLQWFKDIQIFLNLIDQDFLQSIGETTKAFQAVRFQIKQFLSLRSMINNAVDGTDIKLRREYWRDFIQNRQNQLIIQTQNPILPNANTVELLSKIVGYDNPDLKRTAVDRKHIDNLHLFCSLLTSYAQEKQSTTASQFYRTMLIQVIMKLPKQTKQKFNKAVGFKIDQILSAVLDPKKMTIKDIIPSPRSRLKFKALRDVLQAQIGMRCNMFSDPFLRHGSDIERLKFMRFMSTYPQFIEIITEKPFNDGISDSLKNFDDSSLGDMYNQLLYVIRNPQVQEACLNIDYNRQSTEQIINIAYQKGLLRRFVNLSREVTDLAIQTFKNDKPGIVKMMRFLGTLQLCQVLKRITRQREGLQTDPSVQGYLKALAYLQGKRHLFQTTGQPTPLHNYLVGIQGRLKNAGQMYMPIPLVRRQYTLRMVDQLMRISAVLKSGFIQLLKPDIARQRRIIEIMKPDPLHLHDPTLQQFAKYFEWTVSRILNSGTILSDYETKTFIKVCILNLINIYQVKFQQSGRMMPPSVRFYEYSIYPTFSYQQYIQAHCTQQLQMLLRQLQLANLADIVFDVSNSQQLIKQMKQFRSINSIYRNSAEKIEFITSLSYFKSNPTHQNYQKLIQASSKLKPQQILLSCHSLDLRIQQIAADFLLIPSPTNDYILTNSNNAQDIIQIILQNPNAIRSRRLWRELQQKAISYPLLSSSQFYKFMVSHRRIPSKVLMNVFLLQQYFQRQRSSKPQWKLSKQNQFVLNRAVLSGNLELKQKFLYIFFLYQNKGNQAQIQRVRSTIFLNQEQLQREIQYFYRSLGYSDQHSAQKARKIIKAMK